MELLWFGSSSVNELAASLDLPPDRLYYHLRHLVAAGLVVVGGHRETGSGRAERVYAAAATEPVGDGDALDRAVFMEALLEVTRAEVAAAHKSERERAVTMQRAALKLTPKQFLQLKQQVKDLIAPYAESPAPDGVDIRMLFTLVEVGR
jgi:predicted ArsR family transcriptional regulator